MEDLIGLKSHYSEFLIFTNISCLCMPVNYKLLKFHEHIKKELFQNT